ncbi:hypothetical protein CW304_24445 [Bacillus sp. UFRGS-B20]|nr:hypothetical protein CW304_24445 [Bacillus sp. UFRGS-B20]
MAAMGIWLLIQHLSPIPPRAGQTAYVNFAIKLAHVAQQEASVVLQHSNDIIRWSDGLYTSHTSTAHLQFDPRLIHHYHQGQRKLHPSLMFP